MNSSLDVSQLAETLIVIAGDNAWNAARAFGSDYAQMDKPAEARQWRNVAKAVLRKYCNTFASPAELKIAPAVSAEVLPMADTTRLALSAPEAPAAEIVITIEPEIIAATPIPLRARRQMATLPKPVEAIHIEYAKAA